MKLSIVTISSVVFSGDIRSLTVTTPAGATTVLPGHISLLTVTKPGPVRFVAGDQEIRLIASGGSLEVRNNTATLLVDEALPAEQVDVERAQAQRARLLNVLKSGELTIMQLRDARRDLENLNAKLSGTRQ